MKNTFATQKPSASEILKEIEDQKKKSSIIVPMIINRVFNIEEKLLPNIEWYKQYIQTDNERMLPIIGGQKWSQTYDIREKYVKYSFPILNDEFFKSLKTCLNLLGLNHIVELSAGAGWLTHWARKYGINIKECVDNYSWKGKHFENNILDIVKKCDSRDYIKKNNNVELFILSWSFMCPLSFEIWNLLKPGQYLLSIGESVGGCTDSDKFFNAVEGHKIENSSEYLNKNFISFCGIHDICSLYKK